MERDLEKQLSKKSRFAETLASAKPLESLSAEFESAGAEIRSAYKRKAAEMTDDESDGEKAGDSNASANTAGRQLDLHALMGDKTLAQYAVRGDETQWKRATETLELSSGGRRLGARGGPSHVTLVSAPASGAPSLTTERTSSGKKSNKQRRSKPFHSNKQHKNHK